MHVIPQGDYCHMYRMDLESNISLITQPEPNLRLTIMSTILQCKENGLLRDECI